MDKEEFLVKKGNLGRYKMYFYKLKYKFKLVHSIISKLSDSKFRRLLLTKFSFSVRFFTKIPRVISSILKVHF